MGGGRLLVSFDTGGSADVVGVNLQHDYFPWELEAALRDFNRKLCLLPCYNNERYHEAIDNVTPADVYFRQQYEVLTKRSKIKRRTTERRKKEYLARAAEAHPGNFAIQSALTNLLVSQNVQADPEMNISLHRREQRPNLPRFSLYPITAPSGRISDRN